jgi:hypothetical protein
MTNTAMHSTEQEILQTKYAKQNRLYAQLRWLRARREELEDDWELADYESRNRISVAVSKNADAIVRAQRELYKTYNP